MRKSRNWIKPKRLRFFCDAYGLTDRSDLLATIIARGQSLIDFLLDGQTTGDARRIANIAAGHLDIYQHDLAYIEAHRAIFEAALA